MARHGGKTFHIALADLLSSTMDRMRAVLDEADLPARVRPQTVPVFQYPVV